MTPFALALAASLIPSPAAAQTIAPPVAQAKCQYERLPGGGRGGDCPSDTSSFSGGGTSLSGFSPVQQMQLNMVSNLSGAAGSAIAHWLTTPAPPRVIPTVAAPPPGWHMPYDPGPYRPPPRVDEAQAAHDDPCAGTWNSCADALAAQGDAMNDERIEADEFKMSGIRGISKAITDKTVDSLAGWLDQSNGLTLRQAPDDRPAYEYAEQFPNARFDSFNGFASFLGQTGDHQHAMDHYAPKTSSLLELAAGGVGDLAKKIEAKDVRGSIEKNQDYFNAVMECGKYEKIEPYNACVQAARKASDALTDKVFGDSLLGRARAELAREARDSIPKYAKSAMTKAENLIGQAANALGHCR